MTEYAQIVANLVKEKKVLDIGSIGHSFEKRYERYHEWMFDVLLEHADKVVGIDYLRAEVKKAQENNYDIRYGDAQNFDLGEKFDIVFAGDLIEHLSNPGSFIESCKRHLNNGGKIIVATPNTFSLARIFRIITQWTNDPPVNKEHTAYFTPKVLNELFRRYNFKQTELLYTYTNLKLGGLLNVLHLFDKMICILCGRKFREAIVSVYEKP